jgi:pimeloyl-ACP methyl ester carboxylesterase
VSSVDEPLSFVDVVVLVHGAFADGSSWNGVIERLQSSGVPVVAPANPLRGIAIDSAYLARVFAEAPGPSSPWGGFVAQEMTLIRPALVRRLVLAATGSKGGPRMHGWRDDIEAAARAESRPENLLYIMFAHTDTSQAKGVEFLGRFMARTEGRDAPTSDALRDAQYDAVVERGIPDHAALQRLTAIRCPTLILQGDGDPMFPTPLSHLMAGLIPDAEIRIYPDSAHGFLFQEPQLVEDDVSAFLT